MSFSQLTFLAVDTFKYTISINRLYLNDNSLVDLPSGLFRAITNLQVADLMYNKIKHLRSGLFPTSIDYIDLKANLIVSMEADVFDGLEELIGLYLSHNKLFSLPLGVFNSTIHLYVLFLDYNHLRSIYIYKSRRVK